MDTTRVGRGLRRVAQLTLATAIALGAVGCGGSSQPVASNTPSSVGSPSMSAAASTPAANSAAANPAVVAEAVRDFRAFLSRWVAVGACSAAADYLTSDMQCPPAATASPTPGPSAGSLAHAAVVSYQVRSWSSANTFTLEITFRLDFRMMAPGNWSQGNNTRFVTFGRPDAKSPYRFSLATGP